MYESYQIVADAPGRHALNAAKPDIAASALKRFNAANFACHMADFLNNIACSLPRVEAASFSG